MYVIMTPPTIAPTLTKHPNGKIYVPLESQAAYNFILNPLPDVLEFMRTYCTQYIEEITQDELRIRMADGVIRTGNGVKYTVNWTTSAAYLLKQEKVVLHFRTPKANVVLAPRVLVSKANTPN